jgi:hypothetical protein
MYTTVTKKYILYTENKKEVIEEFDSMESLIAYVRDENLDSYIDYPIEEKISIRNFY